jgi:hypothetical protein
MLFIEARYYNRKLILMCTHSVNGFWRSHLHKNCNVPFDCYYAYTTLSFGMISKNIPSHTHTLTLISAKTKDGVQEAFEELVHKVLQTPSLYTTDSPSSGSFSVGGEQEGGASGDGGWGCGCWVWVYYNYYITTLFSHVLCLIIRGLAYVLLYQMALLFTA